MTSEELFSIGDVSKSAGVSAQTIRNWETLGILHPDRTIGGHRRYRLEDVNKLKSKKILTSYEILLWENIRTELISKSQSEDTDKVFIDDTHDGFSYEDINFLVYNNFDICNKTMDDKRDHRKRYLNILTNMFMNKLVDVKPMIYANGLIHYQRQRNDMIVFECEEIMCNTRKINDFDEFQDHEDKFVLLAKDLNQEVVRDLSSNSGTIVERKPSISDAIDSAIEEIVKKTKLSSEDGHFWVVYPPEIAENLINSRYLFHRYQSRLIGDSEILVGFKSEKFKSYGFYPFCLMVTDSNRTSGVCNPRNSAIFAKKLFREGSNFYAKILL